MATTNSSTDYSWPKIKMADVSLREKGWYLSEEGITQCTCEGKSDTDSIIKVAINTDLRDIGKGWLPEDINRGRAEYVQGPGVLQLQKIRNISAPKDNEESQAAPRLMKLVLTDGHTTCSAVETEMLKDIGLNTPPGCKIFLKMTVGVEHGFLLLNNKNTKNLGGRVEKIAEGWELKKKLAKQQRGSYGTDGGPPPFVPFGQKIGSDSYKQSAKRDNFKSLDANKGDKKSEDDKFEQQRQATIAEAMQAKEDGQSKKFGGGQKQISSDFDVATITEMGFKIEEATNALKINNGNVGQAIEFLLKGGPRDRRPQGDQNRSSGYQSGDRRQQGGPNRQSGYDSDKRPQGGANRQASYESDRGRGRKDRRDEDSGPPRGRRGRDQEEGGAEVSSKPSGPATLFDFLAVSNKIPEPKENKEKTTSGKDSSNKNHVDSRERQRTSSGSSDHSNRTKQNVPPRFVNKSKFEQGQGRGQNHYVEERSEKFQRSREERPKTTPSDSRFNSRTQNERSENERDKNSNRNRNYNDRKYNEDRDNRRTGGRNDRNEDRNFKQSDRKTANYDSKSNTNSYKRQSDDRDYSEGNTRQEKMNSKENVQSSARPQKSSDNSNRSAGSSRTNYTNDRGEQGQSRNYQGQSSQQSESRQNQSSASNSYKQDSYSKGGNAQKSQQSYSANGRETNSQNIKTGSDNYVPNQQTQSSNFNRNYNNYPPISSSGVQFQPPTEYVYTEAQPVSFNIKVGDKVMAKYWEDNLFYEAVIEVMAANMPTAVVTFTEYGNTEEVLLSDIRPCIQLIPQQGPVIPADMSVPPPQVFFSAPPPPVAANVENVIQAFAGMEFRRGGGGAAYTRKDNRGQQQFYQPPPQRR